jgi:LuxR family maltose regulon positive regulatory protein
LLVEALGNLGPVTLVLDDLQTITDDEVYEGLLYVIDRLPRGTRTVIATQVDPPLPLARLRAEGELRELRELGFSSEQAASLLRAVADVDPTPADVGRLEEWTEGWAAGLQLAALTARGRPDPVAFLNDLPANAQDVVDYLWDQVLARQPRDVRAFLCETSILDRFSASLCAAVTRRDDAERLLAELERSNVFLVRLDPSRRWYRFHQVFRDVLAREVAALDPGDVADLHRRASEWYVEHGQPGEAIEHALVAGDVHYAADLLTRSWLSLYSEGRAYALLDWVDRLPTEVLASNHRLCLLASGMARSLGRHDDAERWLDVVEGDAGLEGELPGFGTSTGAAVAIVRSMLELARGDARRALAQARRAEAFETDDDGAGRLVTSFFNGVVLFFADQAASAEALLRRFVADVRTADQHARSYAALAFLAYIALDRGDQDEALRLARNALERAHAHRLDEYPQTSLAHGALGAALLAGGDLHGAEEHLEQAVALARRGGEGCDIALAQLHLARLRLRQGDRDAAGGAVAAARSALAVDRLPLITRLGRELSSALGPADPETAREDLTEAELRVLSLLPQELTYREIARRLSISMDTLKTYTRNIRRKLGVASRSEAVAAARRRGLL